MSKYTDAVEEHLAREAAAYEAKCNEIREYAESRFAAHVLTKEEKEKLLEQIRAKAGISPLSGASGEAISEQILNAALEQKKHEFIQQQIMALDQPFSREDVENLYSFLRESDVPIENPVMPTGFSYNAYYQLMQADNAIYSVADAAFITDTDNIPTPIVVNETKESFARNILKFYKANGWPDVVIPPEFLTEEEKFINLREERDRRIAETDYLLTSDYPISDETKEKVIAYRQALRDLPAQVGSPWDGGGKLTPWPVKTW